MKPYLHLRRSLLVGLLAAVSTLHAQTAATDQTITVGRNERVALTLGGTDPDAGEGLALLIQPNV